MQRTPAQRARRRNIAGAASGGIQRVSVVLYACVPTGDPDRVLADLRAYANARDWTVVGEHIDRGSISEPTGQRPEWARLTALIEAGQAQGIVTPMRRMCGLREPEQTALDTWLAAHHAFVVNVWPTSRPLASA
ncbi:hypothetical protein [Streptomyces sp. NPDC045251]|uniref:hypothetical protein n=1 Tax=unclassified Streptomyces TaxID=2593676 RepID=UPI003404B75B